jgi:uncharacterized protein YtpQ (UPF0354 family)
VKRFGVVLRKVLWSTIALSGVQPALAGGISERLRDAIAAAAPNLHPEAHDDGSIHLKGSHGDSTVYADNVQAFCGAHPEGCDEAIRRFAMVVASMVNNDQVVALTTSNVYPVVRSAGMLKDLANHLDAKKLPISRPFTGDSAVLYAVDSPKAIRYANAEDLETHGLSEDRLQVIATANATHLEPAKMSVLRDGLFAAITQDGYGTSRLFDPQFVQALERKAGGSVVVAAPTRDWILMARADDSTAVLKLRDLAKKVFRGESYSVSPALLRWNGKAWDEIQAEN